MCIPSVGRTGTKNEDAVDLLKRITHAFASANPTVPLSCVAGRVNHTVSVAIQVSIAFNALDYRYTKLWQGRRAVGQAVAEGEDVVMEVGPQVHAGPEAPQAVQVQQGAGLQQGVPVVLGGPVGGSQEAPAGQSPGRASVARRRGGRTGSTSKAARGGSSRESNGAQL